MATDHMCKSDRGEWSNLYSDCVVSVTIVGLKCLLFFNTVQMCWRSWLCTNKVTPGANDEFKQQNEFVFASCEEQLPLFALWLCLEHFLSPATVLLKDEENWNDRLHQWLYYRQYQHKQSPYLCKGLNMQRLKWLPKHIISCCDINL